MKLLLEREPSTSNFTRGKLYLVNPKIQTQDAKMFICHTLEDVQRDVKIAGKTAIGWGMYKIIVNMSNRFKKRLPLLIDVPNFAGVRIHGGQSENDTEGCILVGSRKTATGIAGCAPMVEAVIGLIDNAQGQCTIEIR